MTHGVARAGLGITLEYPWRQQPDDWISNPGSLGEMGRVLFHETLHVWQVLSQAFQTNLALLEYGYARRYMDAGRYLTLEEGQRLLGIEQTAQERAVEQELERLDMAHVDPLGFSPHDLYESVARYWDITVVGADLVYRSITGEPLPASQMVWNEEAQARGPTLSAINGVMKLAEDSYSLPYIIATDKFPGLGELLFPLVAHASLQTRQPVQVFGRAMD